MQTVIDERVVEMRFNNADFEKNVAQSLDTLDKLKKSLNFDSAKSLENIGKASKNFSMDSVAKQVDTVQAKFSAMQVVGITALSELTKYALKLGSSLVNKVLDPITSGGMNRALNIENAKFQLEGLHVAWETIKEDLDYGVKDTAYGLDAAAKAAAQLVASQVQVGDQMKTALRGISGVAAMTNSSYEEISSIFTTVAGQGKVMTMQLRQLESRGLNAAATLGKYLGTTEAAVRDMVQHGEIDFQTFSTAMDDAFGEHAKEANKTFTGAMKNVRAALSRIGANFATPYLENARKIFVNLISVINGVNKALEPVYKLTSKVMGLLQEGLSRFLTSSGVQSGIVAIADAIYKALEIVIKILLSVRLAFESVFATRPGEGFRRIGEGIASFVGRIHELLTSSNVLLNIIAFFQGIFNVGRLVVDIFKAVLHAIFPVIDPMESIFVIIVNILGFAGRILTFITTIIRENISLSGVLQFVGTALSVVANILIRIAGILIGGVIYAIRNFGTALKFVGDILKNVIGFIGNNLLIAVDKVSRSLKGISGTLSSTFSGVGNFLSSFGSKTEKTTTVVKKMEENYGAAGGAVAQFGVLTRDATEEIEKQEKTLSKFEVTLSKIKDFFANAAKIIGGGVLLIGRSLFSFFTDFRARYANITQNATGFIDYFKAIFTTIGSYFGDIKNKFGTVFPQITEKIASVSKAIVDFIKSLGGGRIAAIAFAAAITSLVIAVIKAATGITSMVVSVRRVFTTIESILKSKFFTVKQQPLIIQLAEAFAIMAASLVLLSMVPTDNLREVAKVMLELMVAFGAVAATLRIIDFVVSKMGLFSNFKLVNSTVLSLAVSIAVLVGAFAVLNELEIKEGWKKKLLIMGALFAELAVFAVLVSAIAPKLATGSILMVSMALSVKLLVDAFAKLGKMELDGIANNIEEMTLLFLGVAALTAAAGRIRITSAIGLFLVATSISKIMPAVIDAVKDLAPVFEIMNRRIDRTINLVETVQVSFQKLVDHISYMFTWITTTFDGLERSVLTGLGMILTFTSVLATFGAIVGIGVAISKIIFAIGSLGNLLKGFGIAVIGLAFAIKIVKDSLIELGNYTKELEDADYSRMMLTFASIAAALTFTIAIVTLVSGLAAQLTNNPLTGAKFRTNFLGIAAAFVGLAVAINLIAKTLKKMEEIDQSKFWRLVGGISVILGALAIAAAAAGTIHKGFSAILGLIGVVGAMALLLAGVAILSTMWRPETERYLVAAFIGLGVIAASLTAVLLALGTIEKAGPMLAIFVPTLLMIGTVLGAVYLLANMKQYNREAVLTALIGLGVILAEIGIIFHTISTDFAIDQSAKLRMLLGMIGVIGAIAVSVAGLAAAIKFLELFNVGVSFVMLAAAMAGLTFVMTTISAMPDLGVGIRSKLSLLRTCIVAVAVIAASVGILAASINGSDLANFGAALGAITVIMVLVGGLFAVVTKLNPSQGMISKIVTFGLCIVAVGTIAFSLYQLSKAIKRYGIERFSLAARSLAGILGEVGIIFAAVMFLGSLINSPTQIAAIVTVTIGIIGAITSIALSLYGLSKVDIAALDKAQSAMTAVMLAMSGLVTVAGVLQIALVAIGGALMPGGGALVGALALPALIISIGSATALMATGLYIGAKGIEALSRAFANMIEPLKQIEQMDCKKIAEGLIELGWGLGAAALGLAAFDLVAIVGAIGMGLIALALKALGESLPKFTSEMEKLQAIDIESIAVSLAKLAAVGLILGAAAPGIASAGVSLGVLAWGLGQLGSTSGGMAAVNEFGEQMETISVKSETYGAATTQSYASGIISKEGEVKDATQTVTNSTVEILDEAVPKADKAGQDTGEAYVEGVESGTGPLGDVFVNGVQMSYADATAIAHANGYETAEAYVQAIDDGLVLQYKGPVEQFIEDQTGKAKTAIQNELGDVDLNSFFNGLMSSAAEYGTLIGALFGGNMTTAAMIQLNKLMGSFNYLFNQGGLLNAAGLEISQYGANGMDTAAMNAMYAMNKKGGVASTLAKAVGPGGTNLFGDFFKDALSDVQSLIPSMDDLADSIGGVGEAAGKSGKSVKDFTSSLEDTISNQLNIFTKFETKQEISAQQMLDNMKSNIDGFASWSHRLAVLAERGIDQALYQKLAEMGPQGYETVAAFVQMTDEQLQEANQLFATSLTLPKSQADIVGAGFRYAGEMATQGFSNALDEHDALHESIHGFTKDAVDTLDSDLGIASPSTVFFWKGYYTVMGFRNGVLKNITWATQAITQLATSVKTKMEWDLRADIFYEIGKHAIEGLLNGISDSDVNDRLNQKIAEIAEKIEKISKMQLGEESPSKVMRQVGRFATLGLALGLTDAAENVEKAAASVTESAIDVFSEDGHIIETMNERLNYNPIITPMLDLSVLRAQMQQVNSMFNSANLGGNGQNGGNFAANPTDQPAQINFTQNNYSPKELSRIDIYRNTKNQIAMMKGVVKANA